METATTTTAKPDIMHVLEGIRLSGKTNVSPEEYRANIASAMRRQHPQIKTQPLQRDAVCLVGGGPSLESTCGDLVQLLHEGAKLVTVNGAYQWALQRNLTPKTQVVLDARESNARFVDPYLPLCHYLTASTCHPALWDKLEGRERVWMFHPVSKDDENAPMLDDYYGKDRWLTSGGGTTVVTRALFALRTLGYVRFHLFGVDSCWLGQQHHAYEQQENESDQRFSVVVSPTEAPERKKAFWCSGWHLKQLEDLLQIIRVNGDQFLLKVHGDGLVAHVINENATLADLEIQQAT